MLLMLSAFDTCPPFPCCVVVLFVCLFWGLVWGLFVCLFTQNYSVNLQIGWEKSKTWVWLILCSREGTMRLELFWCWVLAHDTVTLTFQAHCYTLTLVTRYFSYLVFISILGLYGRKCAMFVCSWGQRGDLDWAQTQVLFWYRWCVITVQSRLAVTDISLCAAHMKVSRTIYKSEIHYFAFAGSYRQEVGNDTDLFFFLHFKIEEPVSVTWNPSVSCSCY